jgi:hypothetical protein
MQLVELAVAKKVDENQVLLVRLLAQLLLQMTLAWEEAYSLYSSVIGYN